MTVELPDAVASAAEHLVGVLVRERATAGRPVPHTVLDMYRQLGAAVEMSRRGQHSGSGQEQSTSWIDTRAAASILGWNHRRVRRHHTDLDGRHIAGRLVYNQAAVREYAHAMQNRKRHDT